MKRRIKLVGSLGLALIILSACGRTAVTSESTDLWEQLIYKIAEAIRFLGLGGNIGIGIILFTVIIRTLLLPVFKLHTASQNKMQVLQPQIKVLREKYPSRDDQLILNEEIQRLYKEAGVSPMSSMIPLFIQMPILIALYQALLRVEFLKVGHFLWLNLGEPDPYFILPVLAALFTFLSSWLTNKGQVEKNGALTVMTYVLPVVIFMFTMRSSSGLALYWVASNAYQVFQTLLLNNPFKLIAEREAKVKEEKAKQVALRRAQKKALKKRK